jgi:O-antigen ligase
MSDTESKSRNQKRRQFLSAIVFSLTLFGYPLVGAVISALQADCRDLSMPFRLFVVLISVWAVVTRCLRLRFNGWRALLLFVWVMILARLLYDGMIGGVALADYALLFFLATTFLPALVLWSCDAYNEHKFAQLSLILAGASCSVTMAGQLLGMFGEGDLTAVTGRLSLVALNPVSLGNLAASGIFCALVLARDFKLGARAILAAFAALFLAVLIETGSKAPALALALPLFTWAAWRRSWGLVTIAIVLTGMLGVFAFKSPLAARIVGTFDDPSTVDRVTMMKNSLQQIFDHPLLGSSFVELKSGYYPHNIVLEAPMAFGVPLSMAVFLLLAYGTWLALRSLNTKRDLLGLLFLQGLIAAMISGSMFAAVGLWIPLALMLNTQSSNTRYTVMSCLPQSNQPTARI